MDFEVIRLDVVGSTQDELRRRARSGEDVTGLCIRARAQTSGRGRRGTAWASPTGGSYQSVGVGRVSRPWLTLALGVEVASSLGSLPGNPAVLVKWPNDLFLAGAKLGGILTEVVAGQVLVGVGVNVANAVAEGAAALASQEVEAVSDVVLEGVSNGVQLALSGGESVASRFKKFDMLAGMYVEVIVATDEVLRGEGRGIDPTGALMLQDQGTGELRRANVGHVRSYGYPT